MQRPFHKLATWLVLVAYLLLGMAPAQELVICLESDGTVAIESAASGCTPCVEPGDVSTVVLQVGSGECPCVDIPLPAGSGEPRVRASAVSNELAVTVGPADVLPMFGEDASVQSAVRRSAVPRPAPNVALIKTIVFRI